VMINVSTTTAAISFRRRLKTPRPALLPAFIRRV
jgi:hypothetical protein